MDNKSELFDLKREKRELDAFLSNIAEEESSVSSPLEGAVQAEDKFAFKTSDQGPSDSKLEIPGIKQEGPSVLLADKDKVYTPSVNEFIPKFTDTVSFDIPVQADSTQEKTSSFLSLDEGKRTDTSSTRVTAPQSVKPLESLKTMTRFDGTTKLNKDVLPEMSQPKEEKTFEAAETEKKIDKAGPYDFSPEKKGGGISRWIWVLAALLILVLVGYFISSSKPSLPGIGSFFKSDQKAASSSVKEINLLNVRQRFVYNVTLGKNIRVIEGLAENSAAYPVSNIRIAANLYNADGSLLSSMESFSGNVIADAKLENMDAAGLISELKQGKASGDKIPPKGQTPFMVIFTSEVAGVHKLSVLPVDFKK